MNNGHISESAILISTFIFELSNVIVSVVEDISPNTTEVNQLFYAFLRILRRKRDKQIGDLYYSICISKLPICFFFLWLLKLLQETHRFKQRCRLCLLIEMSLTMKLTISLSSNWLIEEQIHLYVHHLQYYKILLIKC